MKILFMVSGLIVFIVFVLEMWKFKKKKIYFISDVEGFEGKCYPVWLNSNQIDLRTQSCGITGFFRLRDKRKSKAEFHGYIDREYVHTTEGLK